MLLKSFNEESWVFNGKHYTIPAPAEYRGYRLADLTVVPAFARAWRRRPGSAALSASRWREGHPQGVYPHRVVVPS